MLQFVIVKAKAFLVVTFRDITLYGLYTLRRKKKF